MFTDRTECASRFYGDVFGWIGLEQTWTLGGEKVASFGPMPSTWLSPRESLWLVVFEVADVEAARALVIDLGGAEFESIHAPFGQIALVADDQNAAFGLWRRP